MKAHWFIPGVICMAIGLLLLGHGEKPSGFDAGSPSHEPSGMRQNSPTQEDAAEARHRVADDGPRAVNASAPARAPITDHRAADRTQFLDPDVRYTGITQTDVNRSAVNAGRHLDANAASPALSDVAVSGSQQTPINIGEYLNPDPVSGGLESVDMSGASENTPSDIGPHLDPDAVTAEVSSVEPPGEGNVGSRLDVDR